MKQCNHETMKIVHLSSEISPFSKTGGMGDVVRSLPRALARLGHEVIIISPLYGFIKEDYPDLEEKGGQKIKIGEKDYPFQIKKGYSSDQIPVYFIAQEELFTGHHQLYDYDNDGERFLFFNKAIFEVLKIIKFKPDVLHCHDWQAGLVPNYLKLLWQKDKFFKKTAVLFTIHNLLFQGPMDWWKIPPEKKDHGRELPPEDKEKMELINFTRRGIIFADIINTVSERYAQEILTPEFGNGLDKYLRSRKKDVYGIINGIDYKIFNPAFDENLYLNYDMDSLERKVQNKLHLQKDFGLEVNPGLPLIGIANRLTEQKGFELIIKLMDVLLRLPLQIVLVGSGYGAYIKYFRKIAARNSKKVAIYSPFDEGISRKVYAASDIYLLPSRYEPCGISQLVSLRYGSIPIVRATGGLSDTIIDFNPRTNQGNGFVFYDYEPRDLLVAIVRAIETYKYPKVWQYLVQRGMRESYSWHLPAEKYVALYEKATEKVKSKK